MDTQRLAVAATHPKGVARCGCFKRSKMRKAMNSCPMCKGKGHVKACSNCAGTGFDAATQRGCKTCEELGYIAPA